MREAFFQKDVQQVRLTPKLRESLVRGFTLIGLPEAGSTGVTVLAVVTQLPDSTFSIKCSYLGFREPTKDETAMHTFRDLGYLTQLGVDSLQPHEHSSSTTSLQLTIA
jgi:hypothetical protein